MLLSSGHFAVYQAESDFFSMIAPAFGRAKTKRQRQALADSWLQSDYFDRTFLHQQEVRDRIVEECRTSGDILRVVMETMARKQGVERWADNTPTHILHIPEIKATISDALFIHVIRDGRDVAASLSRLGWGWAGTHFPWDKSNELVVSGLYWEWLVKKGRAYGRKISQSYLELRYEDLVCSPEKTLRTIGRFIDADLDYESIRQNGMGAVRVPNSSFGNKAHAHARTFIGRWLQLDPVHSARLEASLAPILRELGYEIHRRSHRDFTSYRLRVFYHIYREAKLALKKTPFARLFIDTTRLKPGVLNQALSAWEAFDNTVEPNGQLSIKNRNSSAPIRAGRWAM